MRYKISVTQEDINKGLPNMSTKCPVARAIKRATVDDNRFTNVRVNSFYVWDNFILGRTYRLPRSAQRFIKRFDDGKPVKPFNFYLDKERKC